MAHKSGERRAVPTDEFVPSAELLFVFPVVALAVPIRGRFAGGGIGWGKDCSDITVVVPARFTAKSDGEDCSDITVVVPALQDSKQRTTSDGGGRVPCFYDIDTSSMS